MDDERVEIMDCICSWYDLLGYGTPFVETKWDLNDERCRINIDRIKNIKMEFHCSYSAIPIGTRLAFNDGFASTIDICTSSIDHFKKLLFFLEGAIKDFEVISNYDLRKGFPGIRGIIACGQRFSYDSCSHTYDGLRNKTVAYYPHEFQMNTAFSKAFIIEECGSRANITGNNLYFDMEIYKFLKRASEEIGCRPPQIVEQEYDFLVKIYDMNGWFADLCVERNGIVFGPNTKYNNRGIETVLYKYKSLYSKIDEYAKEAAYQQALRYSKMEDYE